jgi:hypothetical protein
LSDWAVALFEPGDQPEWESLFAASGSGTMLHSREYLAYHGQRFVDRSLALRDPGGRLRGIVPAAESRDDAAAIVSHPGATYGGVLAAAGVTGAAYAAMLRRAFGFWAELGYRELVYKPVPFIYHRTPCQEDSYVLWQLGARVSRRTLSACIDLAQRLEPSSRRKRSLAKARRSGCAVRSGYDVLAQFWPVAESALLERHDVRPVHTLEEIQYLARRFAANIECLGAFVDGELVAGAVLYLSPTATHVQYSLSSPRGLAAGAMDVLIDHAIAASAERGARYVDLGISTDAAGTELNEGLHRFKMEFGAGTIVYEQFALDLHADA